MGINGPCRAEYTLPCSVGIPKKPGNHVGRHWLVPNGNLGVSVQPGDGLNVRTALDVYFRSLSDLLYCPKALQFFACLGIRHVGCDPHVRVVENVQGEMLELEMA